MSKTGHIYIAKSKLDGKVYVGQTINFEARIKQHLRTDLHSRSYFENVLQKYGIERFDFTLMPYPVDWLDFWEAYWISNLKSLRPFGYNCTEGGGGIRGHRHSEETKRKLSIYHIGKNASEQTRERMSRSQISRFSSEEERKRLSEKQRGEKNHFFGKHHSEETRKKLSESRKNLTDEMRKNMSAAHVGKCLSPETKAKMSLSRMGNKNCVGNVASEETRKKMSTAQHRRYELKETA